MPGQRMSLTHRHSLPLEDSGQTVLRSLLGFGLTNLQLLQCMLATVFLLYAADGAMLPAVFKALEERLHGATPVSLGGIVLGEALCHSAAVLGWGALADRTNKIALLKHVTFAWGLLTMATAFVAGVGSLAAIRALAGIVGAAVGPLSQGIVGASCAPQQRGQAFGFLTAAGQAGHIFGLLLAGSTAHLATIGSWRGSFIVFAVLTLLLAWVLAKVQVEVSQGFLSESQTWQRLTRERLEDSGGCGLWAVAGTFGAILRRRSFLVLILQGAWASTTVKAMQNYQMMWFQYLGLADFAASAITSCAPLGCIAGAISSGYVSDWVAGRYPNHGRIALGQVADALMLLALLSTLGSCTSLDPESTSSVALLAALSFVFGFFSIAAYVAAVKPLFAEIVPDHMVAQVMGMAAAIDGTFSSLASTPVVGFITEHVFDYRPTTMSIHEMPEELRRQNAAALGYSIAAVTIISSTLQILSFGLLHCTYPRDSKDALAEAQEASCPDPDAGEQQPLCLGVQRHSRSQRRVKFDTVPTAADKRP